MDLRLSLRVATLLAVIALAGCASDVDWSKPGASREATDADIKACRVGAERIPTLPRPRTAQPSGTGSYTTGSEIDADTQLEQAQRVEACMRARGYQLVRSAPKS